MGAASSTPSGAWAELYALAVLVGFLHHGGASDASHYTRLLRARAAESREDGWSDHLIILAKMVEELSEDAPCAPRREFMNLDVLLWPYVKDAHAGSPVAYAWGVLGGLLLVGGVVDEGGFSAMLRSEGLTNERLLATVVGMLHEAGSLDGAALATFLNTRAECRDGYRGDPATLKRLATWIEETVSSQPRQAALN